MSVIAYQLGAECRDCGWVGTLDQADRGRTQTCHPACPQCLTPLRWQGSPKNLRRATTPGITPTKSRSWVNRLVGRLLPRPFSSRRYQ